MTLRSVPPASGRYGRASGPTQAGVLELGWEMFGELCRALALKVSRSGYQPDLIVGIAKAGVIPGAVVASMLQCDFFSLKISRRAGIERVRERPKILSEAPHQAADRKVLIVDEICTTGETLRIALNALRNVRPAEVRTATSLVRVGGYQPDYHAMETDDRIVFPWDRQIVTDDGELRENPLYAELLNT
ncbi:MAG: phosphoribosyltransferase [Longimicrobiales bacterium]